MWKGKNGIWRWGEQNGAQNQSQPQAAITNPQEENASTQQAAQPAQSDAQRENAVRSLFSSYLQDEFPEEMSVGSNNAMTPQMNARVSAIRHIARKRREEQIEELRTDLEDEEDTQPRWTTVDPSGVMLMSLSDEEDEETDEEEEKVDPSDVPNLSDSDNMDDSDNEGTNESGFWEILTRSTWELRGR